MQQDKIYHLAAGALIALVAGVTLRSPFYGVLAAAVAGAVKEWAYDAGINYYLKEMGKPPAHDVDVMDFVYTAAGGAVASLLLWGIHNV